MSIHVGELHALDTFIAERYPRLASRAVDGIQRMGVDWVREEFRADHLHHSANRPYDFHRYDAVVKRERQAGLHILGLLDYNNTFNEHQRVWMAKSSIKDLTANFVQYATAVVAHYRGVISDWQVWNEPNIGKRWSPWPDPQDYAYLLRSTYLAIKHVAPTDQVVMAGPTTGLNKNAVLFALRVHKAGGSFDIAALQPYTAVPSPRIISEVATLRRLGKPVWFSEIGWAGQRGCVPCGNAYVQANFLSAIYLISAVSGVQHCFWYDYRDDGVAPVYDAHFGLVEYNFRGTPAYRSFVIGRYLMDGSTLSGRAQLQPDVLLYKFRHYHQTFYEMWNDADAYESVNVGWRYHFVNVSSSSFRHVTATYSQRLDVHLHPYTVDYLVPPTLKLHWTQSLPVAGIP